MPLTEERAFELGHKSEWKPILWKERREDLQFTDHPLQSMCAVALSHLIFQLT